MDRTDHAFTPSNTDLKVNRIVNGIMSLPNYTYASARFPTVSFDNENKSTPTQTLKAALALVDVRVLDHVIVAGSEVPSMAERGLM